MDRNEPAISISLETFRLPFMVSDPNGRAVNDDGEEVLNTHEIHQLMEETVPPEATELGSIEFVTDNLPSWRTNDTYFITPLHGEDYEWAIFRISWDDNRGHWEWCGDAKISGRDDLQDAARAMLEALFDNWGYDLNDHESDPYREFLETI